VNEATIMDYIDYIDKSSMAPKDFDQCIEKLRMDGYIVGSEKGYAATGRARVLFGHMFRSRRSNCREAEEIQAVINNTDTGKCE